MLFNIESHQHDKPVGRIRKQNETLIIRAAEVEFAERGFAGASMSAIAQRAGLPKANIHYYFKNKMGLYIAVLSNIIDIWDASLSDFTEDDDPSEVLPEYIRQKIAFAREYSLASRIFAAEIISGANNMKAYFSDNYHLWFAGRVAVFRKWIEQGKIDAITPEHLLFMIWSTTQHYSDFSVQIAAALNKKEPDEQDYAAAAETLIHVIMKGCGALK
ncbi:TetR/AcrR family transcriptional regulator [Nitrincola iocasae]|uniref:TetR family transcriptional regulator n=1 Tax=Nitrincola iocasae TaxID=2614693 RepID=A0A5J6LHG8_9GAMM|nr:TetR/AcrR family transcriptional regulator [Nitrincola iocasae]QEW08049.1 TetR family transcriptional regulator [Nitrincola iocasae]